MKRLDDGKQPFPAMIGVTNVWKEIRWFGLVQSKSHAQYYATLSQIPTTLQNLGYEQPKLMYADTTDSFGVLRAAFPSLDERVIPYSKWSHLPALRLPPQHTMSFIKKAEEANHLMRLYINRADQGSLIVSVDTESDVQLGQNKRGKIVESRVSDRTATMQLWEEDGETITGTIIQVGKGLHIVATTCSRRDDQSLKPFVGQIANCHNYSSNSSPIPPSLKSV